MTSRGVAYRREEANAMSYEPQVLTGLPEANYHAVDAISAHRLNLLRRTSPAHVRWQLDNPPLPSDALIIGRAINDAVLHPEMFDRVYVCEPDTGSRRNSNAYRDAVRELEQNGLTVLKADDWDMTQYVRASIYATFGHIIADAAAVNGIERSYFWHDKLGTPDGQPVPCKARPDIVHNGIIWDLKTTRDASPRSFARDAASFGYHRQLAWYRRAVLLSEATAAQDARLIVVEKRPPYCCALYRFDVGDIDRAEWEMVNLARWYRDCWLRSEWPGYEGGTLTVPAYEWEADDD